MATKYPFEGIRVFELGLYFAAPWCGRMLASFGAEVVRAETSRAPDLVHAFMGPEPGSMYADYGALKKHITLDLRQPKGGEIARELIKKSDVFITNLGKELIAPAGLAYDEAKELKPDIIMVWQPGFGIEGPYATYKAFGGMLQSVTGMCEISGFPGELPGGAGTAFCDYPSSMYALTLISAALDQRRRTGEGTFIEIPLYEVGVTNASVPLVDYMANGRILSRQGNRHPFASPHGAYPCNGDDRWCVITVFTEDEWKQFCDGVGRPEWKDEPKFATLVDRLRNEDELDRLIAEWTRNYTVEEVMAAMDKAGVPVGIVMKGEDLSDNSHLKERGFYLEFEYHAPPMTVGSPVAGKSVAMRVPMLLSETPPRFGPVSRMGEDNDYVYGEILGMSPEESKQLTDEGVFT